MLYLPEKHQEYSPIISVQSKLPIKDRWHTSLISGSFVTQECAIEKIEYMIINERKYRVKVLLAITARQYTDNKIQVFNGLQSDELQVLKETIETSNVFSRKKDTISIEEDILSKNDTIPEHILKYDLNIVENYKQITEDKVVINGFIYANILYSSSINNTHESSENKVVEYPSSDFIHQLQERVEFTQFIPIQHRSQNCSCRLSFDDSQLRIKLTTNDDGNYVFRLEGDLLTNVELYKNDSKELVVDAYHKHKNFSCDFQKENCKTLVATSNSESSVREILSLENIHQEAKNIVYAGGEVTQCESRCEQGKIVTEGMILAKIICTCEDLKNPVFAVCREVPFRVISAISGLSPDDIPSHKVYIKDIWSERINGNQIEFNCSVAVCAEILRESPFQIITNPAFEESNSQSPNPAMVIYICKNNDNLWNIAKKFKVTKESVININNLEGDTLREGQKLLLIK
jgi:hypothetical protein